MSDSAKPQNIPAIKTQDSRPGPEEPQPDPEGAQKFYDANEVEVDEERVEVLLEGIDEIPEEEEVESEMPKDFQEMSKEDIYAKFTESQAKLTEAEGLSSSIEQLGETLSKNQAPPPQQLPAVQEKHPIFAPKEDETPEETQERIDAYLSKTPSKSDEYVAYKLGPLLRDNMSSNFATQRELLEVNENTREFFKQHAGEVDTEFQKLKPEEKLSGKGYKVAFQRVKAVHIDDIVGKQVTEKLDQIKEELRAELKPVRPHDFSETGSTRPRKSVSKRIVLTVQEQAQADRLGLNYVDYARTLQRRRDKGEKI